MTTTGKRASPRAMPDVTIPPGFAPFALDSAYVTALGPLWVDEADARQGLVTTDALANIGGVVHGGALATLADVALFVIAGDGQVRRDAVTLTLNTTFVAPAPLGRFIVSRRAASCGQDGRSCSSTAR